MTDLLLQRSAEAPNEYEVIAARQVVGRVSLFSSSPPGTPWMWSIDFAFHEGWHSAHGFEATREAALQAFTRCWFREA
jgi:hypothetical protein